MRRLTKEQWRKRKRRKKIMRSISVLFLLCFCLLILTDTYKSLAYTFLGISQSTKTIAYPNVSEMLLTPNDYSRPQIPLKRVRSIVIHYVGNPGTTAEANRNYFEELKDKKNYSASSHFVIGLEGEIIQCIPLDEISYASNDRNYDTISIECCHPDAAGEFNEKTYDALIQLTAWLCCKYGLSEDDIIRHYDVTGKECPLYYVKHEDAWLKLKDDVMAYIDQNAITKK